MRRLQDLSIEFNNLWTLTPNQLKLLLDRRDKISKNFISKINREKGYYHLGEAYNIYYKSSLWKNCVKPLLIMLGIKKGYYLPKVEGLSYICPHCHREYLTWKQLVPHHKQYPRLAKKYKGKGFDGRDMLNHPDKIGWMCVYCHPLHHKGGEQ